MRAARSLAPGAAPLTPHAGSGEAKGGPHTPRPVIVDGGVSARGKAGVKLSAVECYDVISETWSICAELPILLRVFGGTAETAV